MGDPTASRHEADTNRPSRQSKLRFVGYNGGLLRDPVYSPRKVIGEASRSSLLIKSTARKRDYFAVVNDCPNLNAIGHTRVKTVLHGYKQQWYTRHELDAGFCVAPQWYKSDEQYAKFPLKPRQHGITMCANDFFPISQSVRRFSRGEETSVDELGSSAFVRGFHIPQSEIRQQIVERYWPQARKRGGRSIEDTNRNWISRMASSFVGGKLTSSKSVWLPKGEMYNNATRIQGPAEALQIWDDKMNAGQRSGSIGGFASKTPTYASAEVRAKFEGK